MEIAEITAEQLYRLLEAAESLGAAIGVSEGRTANASYVVRRRLVTAPGGTAETGAGSIRNPTELPSFPATVTLTWHSPDEIRGTETMI